MSTCKTCGSSALCIMCHGSGVFSYTNGVYSCAACWGTGIEHDDHLT